MHNRPARLDPLSGRFAKKNRLAGSMQTTLNIINSYRTVDTIEIQQQANNPLTEHPTEKHWLNGRMKVPYVNIRVTDEGVTAQQKQALINGVTDLLRQILGKDPLSTFVVIEEIPTENWGW